MVDIQLKILDIQTASPAKHSLFIKTEENMLKKIWPGTAMCTMPDFEVNSSKFLLKIGSNTIGEVPLVEFTKEWIHSSKEIHGFRISLAYRVLLKKSEGGKTRTKDFQINDKAKLADSSKEVLEQYTKALENFKIKEKELMEKIQKTAAKKNSLKNSIKELKMQKEKIESELWLVKEELSLEKLKKNLDFQEGCQVSQKIGKITKVEEVEECSPKDELETLKSENSFRFSFGPEAGSEDFEKNLEMILAEILEEKGIEQNILQVSTGIFYIGKVRVQIKISDGEVLAYYKKSYIPIDEFLDVHFQQKKEPRRSISAERFRMPIEKPSKLDIKKEPTGKNLNNSMKIVQDIDKVLEYSNFYKTKY
jgi:hypothetical protein